MSGKRQRNPSASGTNITFCGETLKDKDFRRIQKLIDGEFRPTRQWIARETCRLFSWRRPDDAPPVRACRELLVRLERMGIIRLPLPRRSKPSVSTALPRLKNDFLLGPTPGWTGTAAKDAAFELRPILAEERDGFRAYMQRYHYLGDSPLVGESLRYGAWLVEIVREEFGEGNDFCQKITYRTTGKDPKTLIKELWITVGDLTADDSPFLRQVPATLTEEGRERSRYIEPDTLLLTNSGATLGVPKITLIGCLQPGAGMPDRLYSISGRTDHRRGHVAPGEHSGGQK